MSPAQPVNEGGSYFEVIEDLFIARRGKGLGLSPLDWQLIEEWQESGVQLHTVVGALNAVFDQKAAGQRTATINSLRYCAPAVDEAHRLWQAARVGAHDDSAHSEPANPFSQEKIAAHLERCRNQLRKAEFAALRSPVTAACLTAAHELALLMVTAQAESLSAKQIEESLTTIEAALDAAILAGASPDQLVRSKAAVTSMLSAYRANMTDEVYQQQSHNFLMKRMRESYEVPRLSLFFS